MTSVLIPQPINIMRSLESFHKQEIPKEKFTNINLSPKSKALGPSVIKHEMRNRATNIPSPIGVLSKQSTLQNVLRPMPSPLFRGPLTRNVDLKKEITAIKLLASSKDRKSLKKAVKLANKVLIRTEKYKNVLIAPTKQVVEIKRLRSSASSELEYSKPKPLFGRTNVAKRPKFSNMPDRVVPRLAIQNLRHYEEQKARDSNAFLRKLPQSVVPRIVPNPVSLELKKMLSWVEYEKERARQKTIQHSL